MSGVQLGAQWENRIQFALNLQKSGKSYYAINQFGPFDGARHNWPPKPYPGERSPPLPMDDRFCLLAHTAARRCL